MRYLCVATRGKRQRSLRVKAATMAKAHKRASKRLGKKWHVQSVLPGSIIKGTRSKRVS